MEAAGEQVAEDGLVTVRANVGLAGGVYPGRFYRVDPDDKYVADCLRAGRLTLVEAEAER